MSVTIYIRNLPFRTTDNNLEVLFSEYGEVTDSEVQKEYSTGRPKGTGLVEMLDEGDADRAIAELNGKEYYGKPLIVKKRKKIEEVKREVESHKKQVDEIEDDETYVKIDVNKKQKRPKCVACGDPVKIVVHSGGAPMAAQHCRDCYAELRHGKIPKSRRRRMY